MRVRPVAGLIATLLSVPQLAACGSAGPAASGGTSTTSGRAPTISAPSSTAQPTTTVAAGLAFVTAWGATQAQWNSNHTADPGAPGGYWPRLPDNLDTYTNLRVVGGRVVGYVLNLAPSVSLADAQSRLANDLPLDSAVTGQKTLPASGSPTCDQVIETGSTIRAVDGNAVVVDFESSGSGYSASAVSRVVVAPLGPGAVPPAGC